MLGSASWGGSILNGGSKWRRGRIGNDPHAHSGRRKFSKVDYWSKNSDAKRHVYLTLTGGPLVNVFKILVFVTSSSNTITGVWSNFLHILPAR